MDDLCKKEREFRKLHQGQFAVKVTEPDRLKEGKTGSPKVLLSQSNAKATNMDKVKSHFEENRFSTVQDSVCNVNSGQSGDLTDLKIDSLLFRPWFCFC
jgi:hypothetical protein